MAVIKPVITSVTALSAFSLQVEWNTVTTASETVQAYLVEIINANITVEIKPEIELSNLTKLNHVFKNFEPKAKYDFRVRAKSTSTLSKFSEIVSARTLSEGKIYLF